jgi:multiple sugar transport system ATP-binding protein
MSTSVVLQQVEKRYGDVEVIHGIDLNIEPGEFTVFVGPSGCGKSTLLRMIAGLEPISGGSLLIDGERMNEVPAAKRGIAMVFQSYALYPHMSVYQNLAFGLETARVPKAEIQQRVQRAAGILRIEPLLKRKPKQLSGGQRQRVAIARALVNNPSILLADEPTGNLDSATGVEIMALFERLHQQGNTIVLVTHEMDIAMHAHRVVYVRDGKVAKDEKIK